MRGAKLGQGFAIILAGIVARMPGAPVLFSLSMLLWYLTSLRGALGAFLQGGVLTRSFCNGVAYRNGFARNAISREYL